MSPSNSPCAACKCRRQKCTPECVFAPHFPADDPQKFTNVHRVFGASNVSKLLNELSPSEREDAVRSLAYEAEYRLQDPIYGCVGLISILQHNLKQVRTNLEMAKKELAAYIGPSAMLPILNPYSAPYSMQTMPQQLAAVDDLIGFNGGFDDGGAMAYHQIQQQEQQHLLLQQHQSNSYT